MNTASAATAASSDAAKMTLIPNSVGPEDALYMALGFPRSDFEVDHLGHDHHPDRHPGEPAKPGDDEPVVLEETAEIFGVRPVDEEEDDEGQRADDVGRG